MRPTNTNKWNLPAFLVIGAGMPWTQLIEEIAWGQFHANLALRYLLVCFGSALNVTAFFIL